MQYSVIAVMLFILVVDLGIRVFAKKYRSYSEINYGLFYTSPFYDGFTDLKRVFNRNQTLKGMRTHCPESEYTYCSVDFKFKHKFNEYGLRERRNIDNLIKGKTRVLTLGDSFTEGVGTNQDSTWQRFLENKLNSRFFDQFIVINAGISGSDPCDEFELFCDFKDKFKPDYVILSIGSNDILDLIQRNKRGLRDKSTHFRQPLGYYFYSWSYLFRVFSSWIYDYPEFFMNKNELQSKSHESAKIIKEMLLFISEIGIENSFKTIVVFYPVKAEVLTGKYNSAELQGIIDDLQNNSDIQIVDLLSFYKQSDQSSTISKEFLYWPHDAHMTALGYGMWAEILYSDALFCNDF